MSAPAGRGEAPRAALAGPTANAGGAATGGCHAGGELERAAREAGASGTLDRYASDYPRGPHDKPQSMCPAFGSLRTGLRMRRVGTILSGSACCVYGLTFVSHFYGARRSVGYVPFSSESLVTGKLFEDIREAVHQMADPAHYDAIVVTNLCVPTASGVPLRLLPKTIDGVRIVGIDVPGFGVPTHAEAKDVLASAMLAHARSEAEAGPVARPDRTASGPAVALLGEMFPADPMSVGALLAPMGVEVGPVVPAREWRELYAALACDAVAAIHPFYTASVREFAAAGRPAIGSAPVGVEGTHDWLASVGETFDVAPARVAAAQDAARAAVGGALEAARIDGTVTVSGYEGSELLVARLLIECGARVPYVGTACPRTPHSEADRQWLEAHGATVRFRASLEDDLAAALDARPDLAIGTTPVVQRMKEAGTPALYFTNLISARPLMGAPGPGSLAQVIRAAMGNRDRIGRMRAFFEGVGQGDAAGVWEGAPRLRPDFRALNAKKMAARAKALEAERMV